MDVKEYLASERQWRREHRISRAKMQMEVARTQGQDVQFWQEVLKALED